MKQIILAILICFTLTGCSLVPKINFDSPGTTPQTVEKAKVKEVCKGDAKFNENGDMISCTKGYYLYKLLRCSSP